MSEQYEPSYYEIALTGRQVLAAFVILLVCLVAAFFSGVWVGRGGRGDHPQATEAAAQQGPAEEPRGRELSFFDEKSAPVASEAGGSSGEAAGSPPAVPSPAPASSSSTGQNPASGPAQPSPAATGAPARGDESPPAPHSPSPAPQPTRSPSAREAAGARGDASRRDETNPSGSLATGDVVIQVFSSGEESKAREVLDLLEKHGFRAFLSPVVDGGRTLYRVRVGPFEHKSEAQTVAEKLHSSLNLETWITQ